MKGAFWDVDVFVVVDRVQSDAVVEDVFTEFGAFAQFDVGHPRALLEGVVAEFHVFAQEDVDESPAALEGVVFEDGFVGDIDGVDVRAALEGVCADAFQVGGQKDAGEVEASLKGFFGNGFARKFDVGEVAANEGSLSDVLEGERHFDFAQLGAPFKGAFWDFFQVFGQSYVGEPRAEPKGVFAQGHSHWDSERGEAAAFERVVSDVFQRGGEHDGGKVAPLERAWSEGFDSFWHEHGVHRVSKIVQRAFGDVKHVWRCVCIHVHHDPISLV